MSNFLNMKNNLIQNFYIIGVTQEDINSNLKDILSNNFNMGLSPKIISKFPETNSNYNMIPNEVIIDHCFPTGYKIIKGKKRDIENKICNFWFRLDNLKYNYLLQYQQLYSKIYFTCLKFNESFHDCEKIKSEMNLIEKENNKENQTKENNTNNNNNLNSFTEDNTLFFPKVICFASLIPFQRELTKILKNLYDYFIYYKTNINKNPNNEVFLINDLSPIEKIIEQIVMCIPFPISIRNDYCVLYKFNFPILNQNPSLNLINAKSKSTNLTQSQKTTNFPYNNTNINFQTYDPLNTFMNNIQSISLYPIFSSFSEEEVIKIFKYIILEIPILFFSEDIELLTKIIEGFLSLLSPFEYVQPHISVLPSKFYGIINTEYKFIFGINESFNPDFFKNNNILLDKTIIAVHFMNQKAKIEEIKKIEDQKDYVIIDNYNIFNFINNESVLPNGAKIDITNIELPLKYKKNLMSRIKLNWNETKKKKTNSPDEFGNIFNQKTRYFFYKFLVNILSGFTDYLQRVPKYDINNTKKEEGFYFGDSIRFKINYNNNFNNNNNNYNNKETLFIKAIFNMDEFISKFPKDNHIFYKVFCNTKLFYNFIRKYLFPVDEQISLSNKYFNVITFFKKHKEIRKQYKYKERFSFYEDPFKSKKLSKTESKIFINILNDMNFNSDEKQILIKKKNEALTNYNQIINISKSNQNQNENIEIKYITFPKLFFDNTFFDIPYYELFYRHYLEMPSNSELIYLYKEIKKLNEEYDEKYEELIYSKNQNETNNPGKNLIEISRSSNNAIFGNNSNINFEVLVDNYIEFNWLLLISCSLWYCHSQMEIEIRINKIFDILEKIEFIEEQVLFFLYISIYKYGTKSYFIKMFEFINRFMGYSSYTNLLYMCLKLNQKEKDIKENNNNEISSEDKEQIKIRSFVDINELKKNLDFIKYESSGDLNLSKELSGSGIQKEEIVFYTTQICPKCKAENKIENIYDKIHHRISKKREKLFYKCNECGEEKLEIKIRYKITLNNKKKGEPFVITEGIFKLIPPHKIYQEIKEYLLNLDNCQLDIDNIFTNEKIHLLNNIFYFSDKLLPFDFLIPYEGQGNRDYFFEDEENIDEDKDEIEETDDKNEIIIENDTKKDKNKRLEIFSINNNFNFSLVKKG